MQQDAHACSEQTIDEGIVGCLVVPLQDLTDGRREVVAGREIGIRDVEAAGTGMSGELPGEFTLCSVRATTLHLEWHRCRMLRAERTC